MNGLKYSVMSLILVLFLTAYSYSQDTSGDTTDVNTDETAQPENAQPPKFGFGFQFGAMTIDGVDYNSIRLQPDFSIGKFGIGLDVNFEFDANGNFRTSEWNSWQAILSKILYVRYGQKGEPLYVKAGGIDDFTLGHGFILDRYSNMLNYPAIRKVGFAFDMDFDMFGFESVVNNIFIWDILGLRAYVRPLSTLDIPVVNKLEIGATVAADLGPQNPVPPADNPYNFQATNSGQTVTELGVDAGLPVVDTPLFNLNTYLDFASIISKGTGEELGANGKIAVIIPYKMALRLFQSKFLPSYFDSFYDANRSYKFTSLDSITNGYAGWLFATGISLFDDKISLNAQMESEFADGAKPALTMNFNVSRDLLKLIGINITWTRQNISTFGDVFTAQDANSILLATGDYYISDNLILSLDYKMTFEVDSTGAVTPFTSTSISTKIKF